MDLFLQETMTILNVHAHENTASKHLREKLIELQGEIDKSAIMIGDINLPLLLTDRTSEHKISKHIVRMEYTFSSNSHRIFTKIDCILGHKTHLSKH